jgi:hypothetical protein
MEKPEKPLPGDCCGSGCSICVYEIYYEQMEKYQRWKKQQESDDD